MIQITGLKASPNQTFNIPDPDNGTEIYFTLQFRPRTRNWYVSFTYGDFVLNGMKLVLSPNILHQYSNRVPFGLAVSALDKLEPMFINDFSTSRVILYILTGEERQQIEADINNGVLT